jgi:hypothetical protein
MPRLLVRSPEIIILPTRFSHSSLRELQDGNLTMRKIVVASVALWCLWSPAFAQASKEQPSPGDKATVYTPEVIHNPSPGEGATVADTATISSKEVVLNPSPGVGAEAWKPTIIQNPSPGVAAVPYSASAAQ